MANYLLCSKEFRSLGKSYIESAKITNISVKIDDEYQNRTEFLKYGNRRKQTQKDILVNKIDKDLKILKDSNDKYYFEYDTQNENLFTLYKNDKLSFDISDSDIKIFCIINDIIGAKHYVDFFNNFTQYNEINIKSLSSFRYDNIEESTNLYELFIDNDYSLENVTIPFFMPEMYQKNMSSEKKILIHVSNSIKSKFDILLACSSNYYINNLDCNDNFCINHQPILVSSSNYITYVVSLLYNGENSWFII